MNISLSHTFYSSSQNTYDICQKALYTLMQRQDVGFLTLPYKKSIWAKVLKRVHQIKPHYNQMAVVGIGGSSLSSRMLYQALSPSLDRKLLFFENVDSVAFWNRIKVLHSDTKTHWVIVSKSGMTLETLTQTQFIHQVLSQSRIPLCQQATVITEPNDNPLYNWACQTQIPILEIPKDIVGRYSCLSPVGLLPIAFAGGDITKLQDGAIAGLKNKPLVIDLASQVLDSWQRKEWMTFIWCYSDYLKEFGLWFQQLWSESLTKAHTRQGSLATEVSFPIPLVGSNDQHSILQALVEGAYRPFIWFIRSKASETFGKPLDVSLFSELVACKGSPLGSVLVAEMKATRDILSQKKTPSLTLTLKDTSATNLGELVMVLQMMVGTLGEILNINVFDQPGVVQGKRLAQKYLTKT